MSAGAGAPAALPRLGFLGVGWIGRARLESVLASGSASVAAIADTSPAVAASVAAIANAPVVGSTIDDLLKAEVDGVVIATPSALHAEQALAALTQDFAVFCQKPLGRNAAETRAVVDAAARSDRLLGVDLSYRHLTAAGQVRRLIQDGELGRIFAVEATFHNAYSPDKAWARDASLAGGGCLIDLGIHLVDLSLWLLGFPPVAGVSGQLMSQGALCRRGTQDLEDYATARIETSEGASISVTCSWNLPIGQDADIRLSCYGTRGGAAIRNVNGSFYDFGADRLHGSTRQALAEPPDAWGGRAFEAWVQRLAQNPRFDPRAEEFVRVADVLDRVYAS
jgi:predicted dehydrogenase